MPERPVLYKRPKGVRIIFWGDVIKQIRRIQIPERKEMQAAKQEKIDRNIVLPGSFVHLCIGIGLVFMALFI
jgi:hypothetical protein